MRAPPNQLLLRLYATPLALLLGRLILLLTTTGRKTGLPRTTPLQYEHDGGCYLVGSSRGKQADWFRNILANPQVGVQVGMRYFQGHADPVTDPRRIADLLELRLQRHPLMVGKILEMEGLGRTPGRARLEIYACKLAMVVIQPDTSQGSAPFRE
jgi:deazaflavin-dependent oxidoreductase (nitroreductase family)